MSLFQSFGMQEENMKCFDPDGRNVMTLFVKETLALKLADTQYHCTKDPLRQECMP